MKTISQLTKKSIVFLIFCFAMAGLSGCEDLFPFFEKDTNKTDLYSMIGQQTVTSYSEWPIPEGEDPTVVTSSYRFPMLIDFNAGNDKQIRLYGLEGADVGKREQYLYHDCNPTADCKVIGRLDGEELTIDLRHEGGSFRAEGAIRNFTDSYDTNDFIELAATYTYQQTIIQYELRGEVVIE